MNRKNVEDIYPLSPLQQGMLFHALYSPQGGAYVEQWPLLLDGAPDADALHRAFQRAVDRHAALRTALAWEGVPQPLQVVMREARVPAERLDWSDAADDAEWMARMETLLADGRRRGFDLAQAPLVRLTLARIDARRTLLVFAFHHAVLDGWSAPLVFTDVLAFYRAERTGTPVHLPPAPRFRDYIGWLHRQDAAAHEAYWRGALAGITEPTPLPLDRGGPDVAEAHAGARLRLDDATTARLHAFARARAVTLSTLVQGAWSLVLARYAGTEDVVFGATVSGRPAELPHVERMVGLFINTLPVRIPVPMDASVGAWLAGIQQRQAEMRQHEHARLVDVRGWSQIPRDRPLFGSIVVFENAPGFGGGEQGGGPAVDDPHALRLVPLDQVERSTYPLTLVAVPHGELQLRLAYDTRRFSDDAARRMLDALRAALVGLAVDGERHVGEVPVFAPGEREQLMALALAGSADSTADADADGAADAAEPVHARVAARAARTPHATALEWDGGSISYGELEARANALAHRLVAVGVRPEARVALCLERAPEMVVAMLAVLKAGAAYVPVDPELPEPRMAWMLADARPSIVLTQARWMDGLPSAGVPVLAVDGDPPASASAPVDAPPVDVDPQSIAYVIYTSGSTGTPKGVEVPHGALSNHMAWMRRRFPLGGDGAVLQKTPFGFDASVWEFWAPLMEGARLVIARPGGHRDAAYLVDALRRFGVTTLQAVPSLLAVLADEPGLAACTSLRRIYAGGEALSGELVRRLRERTDAEVVNLYGPTEATIDASFHVAAGDEPGGVPIGRAVDGNGLYVLDDAGRLVPRGAPGELCIGGAGLARGYGHRAALTAERFVPDAVSGARGARLYRTGDRVRWTDAGVLEYIGRTDFQVKVRGFRVEPGEIEGALRALPAVAEAAVVAREDRLVAYATPRGGARLEPSALRDALARTLPEHLVPAVFVVLDALPRTPSGKVDRRALPAPAGDAHRTAFAEPATETERALAAAWSEVLNVERVGADDSFFALGGHSLRAMQLVSRVRAAAGVELPLRAIFEAPRLRDLAARVDARQAEARAAEPIPRADRDAPIPLSFAQERLWFLDQLDPGSAAYNVPFGIVLRGALDADALGRALGEVVRRHEVLRTAFLPGESGPVQHVLPPDAFRMQSIDLCHLPADGAEREMARRMEDEARRPFHLARGPLIRATLFRVSADRHGLMTVIHHAATDAWATGVLLDELSALYDAFRRGEPSPLAELPVQFADFAAWQRASLAGDAVERQLDYWTARLAGAPSTLELPTDRARPAVQDLRGGTHVFTLSPGAVRATRALAAEGGATAFMVLAAAFAAVLRRWTGQDDVVIGTPVIHRPRRELEGLIGFFSNTLPLRMDLSGDPDFRALLGRVRETTLDAYAHQDVPFEQVVDALGVERSLSHAPVFQVMLTHQTVAGAAGRRLGDLDARPAGASLGTSRFDMTVGIGETADGIHGDVEFAAALWDRETVARLVEHLDATLRAAGDRPDAPVSTHDVLTAEERARVVHQWNATRRPSPAGACVHDRFARQAALTPDAPAVEFGGQAWTYAEVEARANRIARRLRRMGVGPDVRVAVCLERSLVMPAAVLAVLKAGGGYVAVDPQYPADRVAYMLDDSRAAVLLTTADVAARLPRTDTPLLRLDADAAAIESESAAPPSVSVHPENLGYVLYTSGSTGRPKGAALPHRALVNLLDWQAARFGALPAARTLQFASLSFDVSFQEIFGTWAGGGSLVLVDDDTRRDAEALVEYLRAHGIERLFLPFAALQNLAETAEGARLPELREVVTAGEQLRATPQLRAFFAANPGLRLDNQYGPSETHVISAHRLPEHPGVAPAQTPAVDAVRVFVPEEEAEAVLAGA